MIQETKKKQAKETSVFQPMCRWCDALFHTQIVAEKFLQNSDQSRLTVRFGLHTMVVPLELRDRKL